MERITSAQPPPYVPKHAPVDLPDIHRLEFPIYMCKSRRGVKGRDECKETYKLPHRLIEKKRRDRINECIGQLKDLLPEHLKLTTLGHLEKAVVLELTLKHVKTLSNVLEQQQQKIMALQKDLQINDHVGDGAESNEEMFRSGFHLCAREVLHYLASQEASRDLTPSHLMSHIQKVASEVLHRGGSPPPDRSTPRDSDDRLRKPVGQSVASPEAPGKNCVPVIQRTCHHGMGEQSGSDTDTDSGYGGEHDKTKPQWLEGSGREGEVKRFLSERTGGAVKEEGNEPRAKRLRADSEDEMLPLPTAGLPGAYMNLSPNQPPFCLPFYLVPPSTAAAAAYLPMLDKCWYPGGIPLMYPGLAGSPGAHLIPMDSPILHKTLRQVSPLNLETKD